MRRAIAAALPALLLACTLASAQGGGPSDADARRVWAEFQAAVKADDKAKIASLMRFPLEGWDEDDLIGVTQEDYAKFYPKMFTPFVKTMIANGKLVRDDDNTYEVTAPGAGAHRGDVYSLFIEYDAASGFKVTSLAIGEPDE